MTDEKKFSETESWRTAHVYDVEPTIARDWGSNDFETDPPKREEPAKIGPQEAYQRLTDSIGAAIQAFGESPELDAIAMNATVVGLILRRMS